MKIGLVIAGAVIALLGVLALMGKLNFSHEHEVAKVGSVSLTDQKTEGTPQWVGILGLVVGGGLIAGALAKKG